MATLQPVINVIETSVEFPEAPCTKREGIRPLAGDFIHRIMFLAYHLATYSILPLGHSRLFCMDGVIMLCVYKQGVLFVCGFGASSSSSLEQVPFKSS